MMQVNRRKTDSDILLRDILALMDLMPVGIRWMNTDGECEYLNRTFIQMFGYRLADIPNINDWFERAYPDPEYRSRIFGWHSEKIGALTCGSTPPPLKATVTCSDGSVRHVIISAHVAMGKVIGIYTDVTELTKAEELQLEIEKMFRLTFEGTRDAIFWANTESGILVNCNMAAEELIEAPRNEIIGSHFTSLHPPEAKDFITGLFAKATRFLHPREDLEAEILSRSGRRVPVLIRNSITRLCDTDVVQGIFLDITERKKAENDLRKSESRYRAMIDAFDGLIYICSQELRIEFMNRQMINRLGYDATGELCYRALHNFESVCPWCVNERVFGGESVQWEQQSPRSGRWYHILNAPIRNDDGIMSKQVMITEITARKQAEQDRVALEAQRMMNEEQRQFLGLVSHEIRTPLAVIDGAAQLILLGSASDSHCYPQAERIRNAAARLSDLIDSCFADERLSTGGWLPDMRLNDVAEIITDAAEHAQATTRIHLVKRDISGLPERFSCDRLLLRVMLANLLDNAVKYSPKGGEINLRAHGCDNGGIRIEVSDEGIGIPADQFDHIFKRFYRTWQISGVVGAGLGLHLVKKIAELHGGYATCSSSVGTGSTFSVMLNPTA